MQPYSFQREAIDSIYTYFSKHEGNPLLVCPTGSGKSVIQAVFQKEVLAQWPEQRILLLTHVKELIEQNAAQLLRVWPEAPLGIYSASLRRRETYMPITMAGIQSVHTRANLLGRFDLIIIDECFPAGTMVSTPSGLVPIESLKPGDSVENLEGIGTVEAVRASRTMDIVVLETTDGRCIRCTESHPFLTARGWQQAGTLEIGQVLVGIEDMPLLRECVSSMGESDGREAICPAGTLVEQAAILLCRMREAGEPDGAGCASTQENESATERDWSQPDQEGRERTAFAAGSIRFASSSRRGLESRVCDQDACGTPERDLSELLQGGHRQRADEDCYRDRRVQSHSVGAPGAGHEEARLPGTIRVGRISREQRTRPETVFNLHVSRHPSYFAEGIAVHNCHLVPKSSATMYGRFLADMRRINPKVKIIGLSATPFRLDSGYLHKGEDRIFTDIAYEIPVKYLIDNGYLSPVITKGALKKIDMTAVGTRGGEFIPADVDKAVHALGMTEAAIAEILKYGANRKSWLIFCPSVDHAQEFAGLLGQHVPTACLHGETPKAQREMIVRDIRSNKLRCVTNCDVLTTGFDAPCIDMIAFLRPTKSASLYIQMTGRGMRLSPGKKNCLVLCFAGNIERHGPVDAIDVSERRAKKLGDGEKETRGMGKECPRCKTVVSIFRRECDCGHQWPVIPTDPKHARTATDAAILTSQIVPLWVDVKDVSYRRHEKEGRPPSMRVEYLCGMKIYTEWICIEHEGFARRKAEEWYRRRGMVCPDKLYEAMNERFKYPKPTRIQVRKSGKFTEVVDYEFEQVPSGQDGPAESKDERGDSSFVRDVRKIE